MPTNLIQIVVGEFEFGNGSNMLYMDVVASLMQKDFSGIKIILLLKDHHLIWSTVKQGIAGYGSDKIIRRKSFFSLSSPCPLVIESIGKAEQIKKVIPELKMMIKEGMVIAQFQ